MNDKARVSLDEAMDLARRALAAAGAGPLQAEATARALVSAEADGQAGHGLSRIPSYALQLRCGKVDGLAQPRLEKVADAAIRVDAGRGFAYPALDLAIEALPALAARSGIAAAAVFHSHHFGQAGAHAERLAAQGLVALIFGNSPKAMAFHGGKAPRLGTNPIAFACPLPDGPPLVVDLALSEAARGRIVAAQQQGQPIPLGWAVDAEGAPTTDPTAALSGALLPIGGAKGSALALMVEILAAALCGGAFGWEASSFFDDQGGPPEMGQALIAIDPQVLSGGAFVGRMGVLLETMAEEPEVRLPGQRRLEARRRAEAEGLAVPKALYHQIVALAGG